MKIETVLTKYKSFIEERGWTEYHSLDNLSRAISVEANELLELTLWRTKRELEKPSSELFNELRDEVSDVLLYSFSLCDKLGIDPLEACFDKLDKNIEKYPINKFKGKSPWSG